MSDLDALIAAATARVEGARALAQREDEDRRRAAYEAALTEFTAYWEACFGAEFAEQIGATFEDNGEWRGQATVRAAINHQGRVRWIVLPDQQQVQRWLIRKPQHSHAWEGCRTDRRPADAKLQQANRDELLYALGQALKV